MMCMQDAREVLAGREPDRFCADCIALNTAPIARARAKLSKFMRADREKQPGYIAPSAELSVARKRQYTGPRT